MGKTHRILIVDDDQDTLANLSDILSDRGFETETAPSGDVAIDKIESTCADRVNQRFDLCLLDFKMPGMDGVELYERITEVHPGLRAIMITAYAGDNGIQRAEQAGTWKVIRKPVDINKLLDIINEVVA